ncbi:MAG: helix-turn-helix domain-containing protein, partial [Gimesia sp.]
MAKKYLNLEEAAAQLGMQVDELNSLREGGDIRGFADRGTWKFRFEDIDELGRSRQADSDPAIPLMTGNDDDLFGSAVMGDDEDEVGEQETVIRGSVHDDDESPTELNSSDSDVRLVVDDGDDLQLDSEPEMLAVGQDSDSDVSLTDDSSLDLRSDSDVKLVDSDSEPDFEMFDLEAGSDSDVKLVADNGDISGSESDVALVGSDSFDLGSESDVALISDDDGEASILAEDSGVSLASDSGISLAGPLDSGISLESADESGISLVDEDASGLSLEGSDDTGSDISITADSGISLEPFDVEDDVDVEKTVHMMPTSDDKNATMEIPALDDDDDSSFDLSDSSADTSVLMLSDEGSMDGSSGSVILDSDEDDSASAMFDDG